MDPILSEKIQLIIDTQPVIKFDEDIFFAFITEDAEELKIVKSCQSQSKSVCGGSIKEGELTFQCFDCAPDPHHMFCYQCFIPAKHKDHKVIFRHNIGGCCDCGDDSTMKKSAFCPKHQGFESVSKEQELAKVPLDLQKKIVQFIKVMCEYYLDLMDQVIPQIQNFDAPIVKLYHICSISNFEEMKLKIEEMTENTIQSYYNKFKKTIYVHTLLFRLITWLIKDKMPFIYLTTSVLLQKLNENSNQCLFADIMDRSVYFESFSPQEIISLEVVLFELHADPEFKKYTQTYFIKNYEKLWLIYSKQDNPYTLPLEEIIQSLKSIPQHIIPQVRNNPKIKEQFPSLIEKYFEEKKQLPYTNRQFQRADFHEHHTQYISQQYQENLFNDPNIINIYKINAKLLGELTQNLSDTGFMTLSCIYIFKLRFEYSFFSNIIQSTLKTILKDNFNQFMNTQICDPQSLASFPYDKFPLTNLIRSFEGNVPARFELTQKIQEIEMKSLFYYAAIQAQIVGIFKSGFNQLISQNGQSQICDNLSKVLLFQCFNSIKYHRNTVIEPDIKLAIEQLVKGDHNNQRVQQMRLNYLQFKNAATLDRLLILFLTYEFCKGEFKDSKEFRNYLTQLFNCDIYQIEDVFLPILKRCLQNLCCIIYGVDKQIEELYNGLQLIAQNEVLESYDFSFIKLYIFIFGNETIKVIRDQLKQLCIPEYNNSFIYIMLRLSAIEGNFYNVCGQLFANNLPRDLLYELQVIMGNIFYMKTFHNYKDIENYISQLPLNKQRLPKHIIQICELDPSVKQLKLKTTVQQRYDPSLFMNSLHLNSMIVEKLLEKKDSNISLINGNGIERDITRFNTSDISVVKQQILKLISTESNIKLLEELIFAQDSYSKTAFKLYFTQLQAVKIFEPQIFQQQIENILKKLNSKKQILKDQIEEQQQIQEIISWLQDQSQNQQIKQTEQVEIAQNQKKNSKINGFKSKYQNKNKQFQESAQFIEINETIKFKDENEEVCYGCKQSINDNQEACQPLLIQGNTISELYSPFSETLRQTLITDKYNYTQLSISNCRHSFHKSCLLEASKKREVEQNYLPIWVLLGCSICKQSYNMTIPILNSQTDQSIGDFNSWLLNLQEDFGIQKYLFEHYGDNKSEIFADIYLQLFVNLINQLVIDPKEYLRNQKQKIFFNLLKIAQKQFQNEELKLQPLQGDDFLIIVLNSLINHVIKSKQHDDTLIKQEFLNNLLPLALNINHENKNEFIQALYLSFDVINQKIPVEVQNPSDQISLQKHISQKLITNIGYQFTDFYNKYFTQGCDLCRFYPMYKTDEQFLCLLCQKIYCIQFCDITKMTPQQIFKPVGNLNQHVQDCHQGNSLFLSIQKGTILLLSSPISILSYKCLYYDNLGQKLDTQNYEADWKQFHMDEQCINHLSEIILFNQYKSIIRNYEVQQEQLDTNARI